MIGCSVSIYLGCCLLLVNFTCVFGWLVHVPNEECSKVAQIPRLHLINICRLDLNLYFLLLGWLFGLAVVNAFMRRFA
jgi:hypothetical protein